MVGGLPAMNRSIVEDMALMNAIVRSTGYTQGWVTEKEGVVVSAPEEDLGTFIEQRMRWVYELTDLSVIGKLMLTIETLMLLVFILSLVISPWNPGPLAAAVLAWISGYSIMLIPSPGNEKKDVLYIPEMLVFQMVYGFVFGWRKLFGKKRVVWKGRVFEK